MPSAIDALKEFWYMALRQPPGIWISTPDSLRLMQRLSAARIAAQDPALANMGLRRSPANPDTEVWICHLGTGGGGTPVNDLAVAPHAVAPSEPITSNPPDPLDLGDD